MIDMGLDGLTWVGLIVFGIFLLMIVALCIVGLHQSTEPNPILVMIAAVAIAIGIPFLITTDFRTYSVSGTVTEVSDVLWDRGGRPFTEVELDSIDHPVRMTGSAGVKELVGQEKTFTCSYQGQTTKDDPIYVCR